MTSYDREAQERRTIQTLRRLWKEWNRPEYTGPYPTAIKKKLEDLISLVENGIKSDA